ncbi:Ste3-like pheromone receptor, partial [Mycena sanguinolenta]
NYYLLGLVIRLFVSNVIFAVNAILWRHSNDSITVMPWAGVISVPTKLQIGAAMALPAFYLCLDIHPECNASVREVHTIVEQRHRRYI